MDGVEHVVGRGSILSRHIRLHGCSVDLEHFLRLVIHLLLDVAEAVIISVAAILSSALPESLLLSSLQAVDLI